MEETNYYFAFSGPIGSHQRYVFDASPLLMKDMRVLFRAVLQ